MSDLIINREGVKTVFKFGNVYCVQDGEGYAVFQIDRESGRQELYGEITFSPHKAWKQFWEKVDMVMQARLEERYGSSKGGIWVDVDSPSHYITNLQSPIVRERYHKRCMELNGRADAPLDKPDRLRFDVDMMEEFKDRYPIPEALRWRAESIRIQYGMEEYKKRRPQQVS